MKTIEHYQGEYNRVWENNLELETTFKEVLSRGFLFQYDGVVNPDVLFLGINPAFGQGEKKLKEAYKDSIVEGTIPYFKAFYKRIFNIS